MKLHSSRFGPTRRKRAALLGGLLCCAAVLLAGVAKSDAALHITEFLADNNNSLNDEDGDAKDWIELFNSGPGSASLDGYYLTDDPGTLTKWQLPGRAR